MCPPQAKLAAGGACLKGTSVHLKRTDLPSRFSWLLGRTIGALRAERQILTSINGTSCSARHELRSRAFLFIIVSAECALPTKASLFAIFARILANTPPPHDTLRTCFVCATHAHSHFCPQHWLLCHLGLYEFEFEFEFVPEGGETIISEEAEASALRCAATSVKCFRSKRDNSPLSSLYDGK